MSLNVFCMTDCLRVNNYKHGDCANLWRHAGQISLERFVAQKVSCVFKWITNYIRRCQNPSRLHVSTGVSHFYYRYRWCFKLNKRNAALNYNGGSCFSSFPTHFILHSSLLLLVYLISQCVRKVTVHLRKVLEIMSTSVCTGLNPFNFVRIDFLQIRVRKVTVRLQKLLEVMSTSFYTGLNPFNFVRKRFLQICLWDVSYEGSYCSF
jgi:hypothetical protein